MKLPLLLGALASWLGERMGAVDPTITAPSLERGASGRRTPSPDLPPDSPVLAAGACGHSLGIDRDDIAGPVNIASPHPL